jgi:endoglucanase
MKMICKKNNICLSGILSIRFILLISLLSSYVFSQEFPIPVKLNATGTVDSSSLIYHAKKNPHQNPPGVRLSSGNSSALSSAPFRRGLNLLDWLYEPRPGQININRYTSEDFQLFKAMGCEAVRVLTDPLKMAGPAPGYKLDTLFLVFLDIAVDRAEAAGLYIVLDNHSWDPVINTDPAIEPVLLAAWSQMALHFKNRSDKVLYEVLNEPHGISDSVWNAIQGKVIQAIRAEDITHTIVVGPANWNSYLNLDAMPVYSDDNLLYTIHFYSPHLFTHQGTTWGDPVPSDLTGVPFPYNSSSMPSLPASLAGTWWETMYDVYPQQGNEAWVKSQLDIAVQFRSERNVPLWCGEFGANPTASPSVDRAAWTDSVRSYLEEKGIGWTFLTGWLFEQGKEGSFETDLDTLVVAALGLTAPVQKEPAAEPESSGFTFYDDFITHGLIEDGWFASGEYDLYSKESPNDGESCLKISGFEQYGTISFRFIPFRDLSFLVNQGATLDFWVRCSTPGTQIEIRFDDTKTSDPGDHPWRKSKTINSSVVEWDGEWHQLQIPLKDFIEAGSWDNNQWYNSQGLFDWKATERLTIDAVQSLAGTELFFDDIRISVPEPNAKFRCTSPDEYQLLQNYPNPFSQSTIIRYRLLYHANVELAVYNLYGQQVAALVNDYQAEGEHEVRFEGGSLAAGIYFYRMKIKEFGDMKKMVHLH